MAILAIVIPVTDIQRQEAEAVMQGVTAWEDTRETDSPVTAIPVTAIAWTTIAWMMVTVWKVTLNPSLPNL